MRIAMLLCAPVLVAAPIGSAITHEPAGPPKWFEVCDHRLVITSNHEWDVNSAVEEVLAQNRLPAETKAESLNVCEFECKFNAWFDYDESGLVKNETAHRLVREQLDQEGRELRIEQIVKGDETMVIIDHDVPQGDSEIAAQVAQLLTKSGFERK